MPTADQSTPVRLFLSYSRSDDEPFVWRLYDGLKATGFEVWFDRVSMPSRQLAFSAEIETAITACDRLVLVVGPSAVASDYVTHEWRFAFHQAVKCVNPIVRLNGTDAPGKPVDGYDLLPEDLRGPHMEDFRDDSAFDFHLTNLARQLAEPLPPVGKLVAVPTLPDHYLEQGDRIRSLRDMVLADLRKPVVVSGASGRVGLHGMGGIGKSLLANALARRPEIRREFPDGVYWVTLGQQPLLVELQRNVAKALGDEAVFTSDVQGRERLRELLKDRAALLILDDAWQREHAEAFDVIGPRCRLLLTTRDAGLVTALAAKENHYQVQLPTVAEARAMLAKAAGIDDLNALPLDAGAVVEECDRLPLATGPLRRHGVWGHLVGGPAGSPARPRFEVSLGRASRRGAACQRLEGDRCERARAARGRTPAVRGISSVCPGYRRAGGGGRDSVGAYGGARTAVCAKAAPRSSRAFSGAP